MVASATGRVAASSKFMLEGARNSRPWSASVYSANAAPPEPMILSPTLTPLASGPEFGDFARPFHPEHGADAAGRAMDMALGHAEVGAVEAAGVDLDQHLRAFRRGLCNVGDFGAIGAVDIGFHGVLLLLSDE